MNEKEIKVKAIDLWRCPRCDGITDTYRHPHAKVWCSDCGFVLREEGDQTIVQDISIYSKRASGATLRDLYKKETGKESVGFCVAATTFMQSYTEWLESLLTWKSIYEVDPPIDEIILVRFESGGIIQTFIDKDIGPLTFDQYFCANKASGPVIEWMYEPPSTSGLIL